MKLQFILFLTLVLVVDCMAQKKANSRPSPSATVSTKYKDSYIKVTYCQPQKRDRTIFGKLVPFGKVWRTGANEATEITLTKEVIINGTSLKAGTYSFFTIPEADKWTIIINSATGLWGAYKYNDKLDVFRFEVTPKQIEKVYESFTIWFDDHNEKVDLQLAWDKTQVSIPITFAK